MKSKRIKKQVDLQDVGEKSRATTSKKLKVEERFWRQAVEAALRQPRLAFYSPVASAVLNYWKNIIPRFSISELLAKIVEKEIASRWPQLYMRAKKSLEMRGGGKRA